jgi:hypothetical protein
MTKEEYDQCKIDQYSDDPLKALQARFILTMFPTEGVKFVAKTNADMSAFMDKSENVLRGLLGEYHDL